ncbi:MAG: CRISPR-associated protein Cas2 [Paraburkholderia tropica]|uniref:CRISPR-associated protein Cas2 n=1 Tax=Paraburkholderia tropica TaxID=92647 RepID=UPI00310127E1
MATFIVGYDLTNKDGHDYANLIDALKTSFSNWWHHLDSTWVIVTSKTAVEVRDTLSPHMHRDDKLFVAQASGVGAWRGFNDKGASWLKDNL